MLPIKGIGPADAVQIEGLIRGAGGRFGVMVSTDGNWGPLWVRVSWEVPPWQVWTSWGTKVVVPDSWRVPVQ